MKILLPLAAIVLLLSSCSGRRNSHNDTYADLQRELQEYVSDKDAGIGIGVIVDGRDTVEVNGHQRFPMMSVYKFPISLALADVCRADGMTFDDSCTVVAAELHRDTYSPMTDRYADIDTVSISLRELLAYTLQMSDNNASDILLKRAGGAGRVDSYVRSLGVDDIDIRWSEDEMHVDTVRCRDNSCTPLAMAALLSRFDAADNDTLTAEIKRLMETCATGTDRLLPPLSEAGALLGHKTGTGDINPVGRPQAINDVGYVHTPDGRHVYSIAVFISDSSYDIQSTSAMIAEISRMVYERVARQK